MAILSFAHLKNKTVTKAVDEQKPVEASCGPASSTRSASGIISFAHLKKSGQSNHTTNPPQQKTEQEITTHRRTTFRIPSVMPTARIIAVNYCKGCPRFMPVEEWEKALGKNLYGRCRRNDIEQEEGWYEVWQVIPTGAIVARCWYNLNEKEK